MKTRPQFYAALLIVVLVVLLAGCSTVPRSEMAWQGLHAIDTLQTLSHAKDPCYVESNSLTQAMIGSNPSQGEVMLWSVGMGVGHALVTRELKRRDAPRWVQAVWQGSTILLTGSAVIGNHQEGIRINGDNKAIEGCMS